MKIASSWSTVSDTVLAIKEAYNLLVSRLESPPDFIAVYATDTYDLDKLLSLLKQAAPNAQIFGGTTCLGVMTEEGFHSNNGSGLGMLGICDKSGSYGVGASLTGDDPRASAAAAVTEALEQSQRLGQMPGLVTMCAAPGYEELMILGIQDVIGPDVPVSGGSSADNAINGQWKQFANDKVYSNALVVATIFPSMPVGYAFHSGYSPTELSGTVTRCKDRIIYEIDGRPASHVYNDWTNGELSDILATGGNVLAANTLRPLGKVVGQVESIPYYRLIHPIMIHPDGSITLFATVYPGDELTLMTGTRESLVSRAGRVVQAALDSKSLAQSQISGVLMNYCAGCMLKVKDDMPKVVDGVSSTLNGKPFLGAFTFGEQGCFLGGENCHGNLMISVLAFGS